MALTLAIIDNDQVNSFVLKNIITRNYSDAIVELIPDGQSGLEYFKDLEDKGERFPDVILLDIYMPGLSGFDFLDVYEDIYSHKQTVIFAMSNSLVKEDQQRANEYSVVKGFITKPLIYNNIQFIIETYVENQSE